MSGFYQPIITKNLLMLFIILFTSCSAQDDKESMDKYVDDKEQTKAEQIGQYVTIAFEDDKGHLWFGTLQKGIARYDGERLKYFTKQDGLPSNRVTSVLQDLEGVYWFHTDEGLLKYDGNTFTSFRAPSDNNSSNVISQFFIDSKGKRWVGTWNGVYTFDGTNFTPFPLPYPTVNTPINKDTKNWITEINEDNEGNIWFARDGYGACKYDGQSFTFILKKDGLHSNNVTNIVFDEAGSIWFGTRVVERDNPDPKKRKGKGGVNFFDGNTMKSFPDIAGLSDNDVYGIYRDKHNNIWISTIKDGLYKYDGKTFASYDIPISIMGMVHDKKGVLWLAGSGGLYKIKPDGEIVNVTTLGPWE